MYTEEDVVGMISSILDPKPDEEGPLYDLTGNEIKIGSILAYAVRKGSSMWHNFGVVSEMNIVDGKQKVSVMGVGEKYINHIGHVPNVRTVSLSKWERAIVIHADKVDLTVVGENTGLAWCVNRHYQILVGQTHVEY